MACNVPLLLKCGTSISFFLGMRVIPFSQTISIIIPFLFLRIIVCCIVAGISTIFHSSFKIVFWDTLCILTAICAVRNLLWVINEKKE